MHKITKKDRRTDAEKTIDSKIEGLAELARTPDEVSNVLGLMERRKKLTEKKTIDPNTIATVVANLAGIGLILHHEQLHVVTSKALGFVIKGRV